MYACMYACMYVCAHVMCTYVCMHVCMSICMYVCVYVLVRVATRHIAHSRHILPAMKRPASSGPAARSSSGLDAWLATLHAQAASASDEAVQVHYLGQQYGRADRALYRARPQYWKLQPGVERRRVVVRFSWQPRTPQAAPASMTQQRNDDARLRGLTRTTIRALRVFGCSRARDCRASS